MDAVMRVFRALCVAGIAVGLAVALTVSVRGDAAAEPLPLVVVTTTTSPVRLGDAAVGLAGPIGAGVEGTTATGTVRGWSWPSLDLPSAETAFRAVLATIAVGCLFVVAAVRI